MARAVPTMRNWTAGEIVNGVELAANVQALGNFLTGVPVFRLRQTVAQSIPNAAFTGVSMDQEDEDPDGGHTGSASTYTIQVPGLYLVCYGVCFSVNATGRRLIKLLLNGADIAPTQAEASDVTVAAGGTTVSAAMPVRCVAGDTLAVAAFQNSTAALLTAVTSPGQSYLSGFWVAA